MTTKVRYGLRAMLEISKNENMVGTLQRDISEIQEIPLKYLDQIIAGLRVASLIVPFSGKGSGYNLAKNLKDITVYEIYRAFEPELTLVNCTHPGNECSRNEICPAKDYWADLSAVMKRHMESTSLSQIFEGFIKPVNNLIK